MHIIDIRHASCDALESQMSHVMLYSLMEQVYYMHGFILRKAWTSQLISLRPL